MVARIKHTFLWLMLLALVACGPGRHTTSPTWTTTVSTTTLADSVWVFSQTYPDGFTLSINTWEQPKEGITVAYSATQDRHDRADLDFVVSHARAHDGYIGGWLDTATGRFYYDSVRLFPEDALEEAVKFGRENGQIAIFILSSSTEIRLEEY